MARKEDRIRLIFFFFFLVSHFAASTLSSNSIHNLQAFRLWTFKTTTYLHAWFLGFFFGSSLGVTDNYNGQLCKTFHPRKHEALRKHSLRLSAGACAARSPVPQLLWISPATKTGCRALWHGQDSAQQGRASPWSTYTASQAGFTARNMLRAAGAELYSPIQAGYLKTEQRHTRLLGVARSTSQDEPQTHFSG